MDYCLRTCRQIGLAVLLGSALLIAGCTPPPAADTGSGAPSSASTRGHQDDSDDTPPALTALPLGSGEKLQAVASTNIVADVVAQIGGDIIDLMPLFPAGADPHGFEPTPQDLIALNDADVIFVNGLGLEESLGTILDGLDEQTVVVSVNAGLAANSSSQNDAHEAEEAEEAADGHDHEGMDPHTWFDIHLVEQWVEPIAQVLSDLDPANASQYAANAAAYRAELTELASELESMVSSLPPEGRKLVTDHDSLGYFARAYDFEIVGTVIPGVSTMASPSAAQLAALHDQIVAEGVNAIFVGSTVSAAVAEQLAADTDVEVAVIYTGSLSKADGPAATYLDFMRYNMATIVNALK